MRRLAPCLSLLLPLACSSDSDDGQEVFTSGMTAGDDDDDDDSGPCGLAGSDALTLGDAQSAPGPVSHLVASSGDWVACGDEFVATPDGSVSLPGDCVGLTSLDSGQVVAATREGQVVLVDIGDGPSVADSLDAGGTIYDVAGSGDEIAIAMGDGGVLGTVAADGSLATTMSIASIDARSLAATDGGWLVGGRDHVTHIDASGGSRGEVAVVGDVIGVTVEGDRALALRGAFGFDVIDLSGGVESVGNWSTGGSAVAAAMSGDSAVVATGAALSRYTLADVEHVARIPRPDPSNLRSAWIRAVTRIGDTYYAAIGDQVHEVSAGEASGAVVTTPRLTTATYGDGDAEVVVLIRNEGNAPMHIDDLEIGGPLEVTAVEGVTERAGCEGQSTVEPDGTMLVTVTGSLPSDATVAELSMRTSDPHSSALTLPVEINRPSLAVGDTAPDFSMMTFDGRLVDAAALRGEVVFLKLFSYS